MTKLTAVTELKSIRKMNKAEVKALPDMLRLADVYSGYLGKDVEPTAERLDELGQALAKESKAHPNSLLAPYVEAESKSDLAMAKIYARRSKAP